MYNILRFPWAHSLFLFHIFYHSSYTKIIHLYFRYIIYCLNITQFFARVDLSIFHPIHFYIVTQTDRHGHSTLAGFILSHSQNCLFSLAGQFLIFIVTHCWCMRFGKGFSLFNVSDVDNIDTSTPPTRAFILRTCTH